MLIIKNNNVIIKSRKMIIIEQSAPQTPKKDVTDHNDQSPGVLWAN